MEKIGFADLEKMRDAGIVGYENGKFIKIEKGKRSSGLNELCEMVLSQLDLEED